MGHAPEVAVQGKDHTSEVSSLLIMRMKGNVHVSPIQQGKEGRKQRDGVIAPWIGFLLCMLLTGIRYLASLLVSQDCQV